MTNSAIVTQELTKRYSDEVLALAGVDLAVQANTIYALLGPNGAGKTTTISILTTLAQPTAGTALVAGFDVVQQPAEVRRRIGVTFQETVLDVDLTGRQALWFHGRLYGLSKAKCNQKIEELLTLVELESAADRRVGTYSGGMKRRLELARGLMTEPEILFLDEPTLGLDPQNRAGIWHYIRDLKEQRGMTLLMTTHYMDEAEQLADCVGIIDNGRIVTEGTPQQLVEQMGADVLRFHGHGPEAEFLTRINSLSFVENAVRTNGQLHIGVDSGNKRLVELVQIAGATGFVIEDIAITKPSLGDVFLQVTGRQFRDE
ncbi:ATP-binding cassette domain-containing protein [Candidatus Leptofilum sp.]|uniref:ATP-binding cassette domain-containing protein n=1 Tax=Candidatus Leptofilum sp. TaxID=3241576 RepID=UPI003B594201